MWILVKKAAQQWGTNMTCTFESSFFLSYFACRPKVTQEQPPGVGVRKPLPMEFVPVL